MFSIFIKHVACKSGEMVSIVLRDYMCLGHSGSLFLELSNQKDCMVWLGVELLFRV